MAVFCSAGDPKRIQHAGERALVFLHGGRGNDALESLRKRKFCDKVAKSVSCVEVQSIPPIPLMLQSIIHIVSVIRFR